MRNKKGVTLVEVVIYIALLSAFLLILGNLFAAILETKAETETKSFVEEDGRYILAKLSNDINKATQITAPAALNTPSTTLTLTIGGISSSYTASANNLNLTRSAQTNNLNSSETNVTNVSFTKLANGSKNTIKVKFTVESKTKLNNESKTEAFETTIGTRP